MKNISVYKFLILLSSFVLFSQSNNSNEIIKNKNEFFDYLRISSEILQRGYSHETSKNKIYNFLENRKSGKNFKYYSSGDGKTTIENDYGFLSFVNNIFPDKIFGINGLKTDYGVGQQWFQITSKGNGENTKTVALSFYLELYGDTFDNLKLSKLKEEVEVLIYNHFHENNCVEVYNPKKLSGKQLLWTFDEVTQYDLLGKNLIGNPKEYFKNNLCLMNETLYDDVIFQISVGLCNNLSEMTRDYYSGTLFVEIKSKINTVSGNLMDGLNYIRYSEERNKRIDIREINTYDLKEMVNYFLLDCKMGFGFSFPNQNIQIIFETLEENTLALSYGYGDDNNIIIKIDPENWSKSSVEKRWYILYHELGHDVLNYEHGEGGKMMFNFVDKDYTWSEFTEDRDYMMNSYKNR